MTALVLVNCSGGGGPAAQVPGQREQLLEMVEQHWGEGIFLQVFAPSRANDHRFAEWWTRFERSCVSPSTARQLVDLLTSTDLRGVLPAIRVPTLVLHRCGNPFCRRRRPARSPR